MLIDIIKNIFEEYSYLKISKDEYNNIVFECLNEIKYDVDVLSNDEISICFENIIRNKLEKINEETMLDNYSKNRNKYELLEWKEYNLDIYLNEIGKFNILSNDEVLKLYQKINLGDKAAKNTLICSNLKLVIKIAKNYSNLGLPLLDLIQEGNIGLITAVEKYDISFNSKFSAFAGKYIEYYILRAIENKSRIIRIPSYLYNKIVKYKQVIKELDACGKEATLRDLSNKLHIDEEKVLKIIELSNYIESLDCLKFFELEKNNEFIENEEVNLDEEKKLRKIYDIISNDDDFDEKQIYPEMMKEELKILFNKAKLPEKNIQIIKLYYGFDETPCMSFSDIAKIYKNTPENIRYIISTSLKKIRKTKYIYNLASYMDNDVSAISNIDEYKKKYLRQKNLKK